MKHREEKINENLGQLLSEYGFISEAEEIISISKSKAQPDVIIYSDNGVKIIIEARNIRCSRNVLFSDAKKRIENGLCDIALALFYPDFLCKSKDIKYALRKMSYSGRLYIRVNSNLDKQDFSNLSFEDFLSILRKSIDNIISRDRLSKLVSEVEYEFKSITKEIENLPLFDSLNETTIKLAEILNIKTGEIGRRRDLIYVAFFIIFDAMIFHQHISENYPKILGLQKAKGNLRQFFLRQWREILKIDYRPTFEFAIKIIEELPITIRITQDILERLRELSLRVIESGVLRRHDFMGRIYHRLLLKTTGKYYATYYTAVPSAIILAELLYKTVNWRGKDVRNLKILDPCCGSGTLLSATYDCLRDIFYIEYLRDIKKIHKLIIEKVIHGLDVLDYAGHLTLTMLALHSPFTLIRKSNIYIMPNDIDKLGNVFLGSLSLLDNKIILIENGMQVKAKKLEDEEEKRVSIVMKEFKFNSFDYVIMNPPYSRSAKPNIKFGYTDEKTRKRMNSYLNEIIKTYARLENYNFSGIGQAGLGAYFIILAEKLLKRKEGRMGIVAPRNILNGVSWKVIRRYLWNKNLIPTIIISSFDKKEWNWSENTDLGEILMILERKNIYNKNMYTFINVIKKPENELIAKLFAIICTKGIREVKMSIDSSVYREIKLSDKLYGYIFKNFINSYENWLKYCVFSHPELNALIIELEKAIKTEPLKNYLSTSGMDIKQVKDNFEQSDTRNIFPIVWEQTRKMNCIKLKKEFVGYGVPKTSKSSEYHRKYSAELLISERPHLNNDALISFISPEEVLASAMWEVRLKEKVMEKFIALWLNSTYGLLFYLASAENSKGLIFKFKKDHLKNLPVPSWYKLKEALGEGLSLMINDMFKKISPKSFSKFRDEFKKAEQGEGVRIILDDFFTELLNIKIDIKRYYGLLADEPFFQ